MRVLVVDDDPAILQVLAEITTAMGNELLTAADGQTGVDLARREQPDLILMDLRLPVLDGVQAIEHLKGDRATAHIATVAMSAGPTLLAHLEQLPVEGHLPKPFDLDNLIMMLAVFEALRPRVILDN